MGNHMAKPRGMTVKDRAGDKYGRLTVLWRAPNKVEPSGAIRAAWVCKCECGNGIVVTGHGLARGVVQSCGCFARERPSTHGMSRSRVYRQWNAMIQRCENPNNTRFAHYAGRGITVSKRWKTFAAFYEDMGDCPPGMTLDRIDNDRGYKPGNCRWASRQQQANNRYTNVLLSYNGETHTLAEWGRITTLGKQTITRRFAKGWDAVRILTEPLNDTGKRLRQKS